MNSLASAKVTAPISEEQLTEPRGVSASQFDGQYSEHKTGAVWDFLTATRDEAALCFVRDKFPDFDLANVPGVDDVAALVWRLRCVHDKGTIDEPNAKTQGRPLDSVVEEKLRWAQAGSTVARDALAWLCDPKARVCKTPSSALKEARKWVDQWQREPIETPFDFSTDADLDGLLGSIEWLWPGYIPRGFVTALVGEQECGKSTVAQDICRAILTGGVWPDGTRCDTHAEKLLWIDTDGNLALFHQRLKSWKMPRGKFVFPPDALQELSIDTPAHWQWIERAIEKFAPPLVVIDALSGSHSGKENDTDSMKAIMKQLHALAQKHKIAVVVIHHPNKAPYGVPAYPFTIDRLRGSSSISQYCRSILALTAPDATTPDARRLDVIKLNIREKPQPVGYRLTSDGPAWGNAPEPPKERRAADDAADFLRETLCGHTRPSDEVHSEARARGIGETALKNAKKLLDVRTYREGGRVGRWFLSLGAGENEDSE